jgi:hypothetical protein
LNLGILGKLIAEASMFIDSLSGADCDIVSMSMVDISGNVLIFVIFNLFSWATKRQLVHLQKSDKHNRIIACQYF